MASKNNLNLGWVFKIKICLFDSTNSVSTGKFEKFDWKAPLAYSEIAGLQLDLTPAYGCSWTERPPSTSELPQERQVWETFAKIIILLRIRIVHNWGRKWNDKKGLHWNWRGGGGKLNSEQKVWVCNWQAFSFHHVFLPRKLVSCLAQFTALPCLMILYNTTQGCPIQAASWGWRASLLILGLHPTEAPGHGQTEKKFRAAMSLPQQINQCSRVQLTWKREN